jgi:hypothetical protein
VRVINNASVSDKVSSSEARTKYSRSSKDRLERKVSVGSIPSRRTIAFEMLLKKRMSGEPTNPYSRSIGASPSATPIGLEIAKFFGASSPKIIWVSDAITTAMAATKTPFESFALVTKRQMEPMASSAITPIIREVKVIPS